jgi:hypothetical protein
VTEPSIDLLDDLEAEFARLTAARPARRPPRRAVALAVAGVVALCAAAYAVPPTRAALDDITSEFAGWMDGSDEEPPGRALRAADDAPGWVRESGGRLIAENAGVGLYVTRTPTVNGTMLMFFLGKGVGMGDTIEGWRKTFDEHAVFVLGASIFGGERRVMDDRGRSPFFGLTARSVDRIELRYADGSPPLTQGGIDGGFVLLVDVWRPLHQLIAYDDAGRELERVDVSDFDLRYYCEKEPGCP